LIELRELGFSPAVAFPVQDFRHFGDDFDQKDQLLTKLCIGNLVERLQQLLRLLETHLPLIDGSTGTGEQTAKQLVDLLTIDHAQTPTLTRPQLTAVVHGDCYKSKSLSTGGILCR